VVKETHEEKIQRIKQETRDFVDDILEERISVPNRTTIIDVGLIKNVFTIKRIQLMQLIQRHNPKSIQELADIADRQKQAVHRDLKILETFEVVDLKKQGRNVIPGVNYDFIMIPIKNSFKNKKSFTNKKNPIKAKNK